MPRRTTSMWIVPRRHSADALQFPSSMGISITLQVLRAGSYCFSAAFIAHAEAVYDDDAIKNDLCAPLSTPDVVADWLRDMLADLQMGGDGRQKKRCVRGSPSTGYRAADPRYRRGVSPDGYAFLSVCAKPVRGRRQT